MEYKLTQHQRAGCSSLNLLGFIHEKDLELLISILIKDVIDKEENCILIDLRESTCNFSELEIINMLRNMPPKLRALKMAVMIKNSNDRQAKLYESIVYSNGFPIRLFSNESESISYLKS